MYKFQNKCEKIYKIIANDETEREEIDGYSEYEEHLYASNQHWKQLLAINMHSRAMSLIRLTLRRYNTTQALS